MPPSHQRRATTRDNRPSPTVSVIIPALNEETNLPLVLEGLPPVDEVIIVDGGSADDTVAVAREVRPDARVVRQTRRGKGNALACGFAAASGDIVVTLNADGSTDPGELPRFVDALISGAEVAHGSRFRNGGGDLGGQRLDRLGNAILSRFVNALFGTRFTDLGYGYNAYWRALLPALTLPGADIPGLRRGGHVWGDGPEIEPLLNIRVAALGMRVVEVSSIGYPPINGVRHHEGWVRALRAMRVAFGEYLRRWRQGRRPMPVVASSRPRGVSSVGGRIDTGSLHVRDLALGQGYPDSQPYPEPPPYSDPQLHPEPQGHPESQSYLGPQGYPEPRPRRREIAVLPSGPLDTGVRRPVVDTGTGRRRILTDTGTRIGLTSTGSSTGAGHDLTVTGVRRALGDPGRRALEDHAPDGPAPEDLAVSRPRALDDARRPHFLGDAAGARPRGPEEPAVPGPRPFVDPAPRRPRALDDRVTPRPRSLDDPAARPLRALNDPAAQPPRGPYDAAEPPHALDDPGARRPRSLDDDVRRPRSLADAGSGSHAVAVADSGSHAAADSGSHAAAGSHAVAGTGSGSHALEDSRSRSPGSENSGNHALEDPGSGRRRPLDSPSGGHRRPAGSGSSPRRATAADPATRPAPELGGPMLTPGYDTFPAPSTEGGRRTGGGWRLGSRKDVKAGKEDSARAARGDNTDGGRRAEDTGGSRRGKRGEDTGGSRRGKRGEDTDSGRRRGDGRRTEDTGGGRRSRGRAPEIAATPAPPPTRPDWRETTDTGQWRDLTSAARPVRPEGQMYDPAADAQHDLDPAARRSLPMYPEPDPAWTETSSGRHAVAESGDRRTGFPPATPWTGSPSDTGQHHRIDPQEWAASKDREIGERRRRLDTGERRPAGRRRIPGERSTI